MCGAGAGALWSLTDTVSALTWQLVASGQPRVMSSVPAVRVTGTDAVPQVSQSAVAGRLSVVSAPPAVTVMVRVWCRPSPPTPLA